MESKQYLGSRQNCLRTMKTCSTCNETSYQPLHETVTQTLQSTQKSCCNPASLCPSLRKQGPQGQRLRTADGSGGSGGRRGRSGPAGAAGKSVKPPHGLLADRPQ